MSTESVFVDFPYLVPATETALCACPLIDVHGISPLPMGLTIPVSYDDSSTKMIAIFFGFICFFLLSAFIILLWWPMKDTKIRQGDSTTDVESLPSDWSFGQNEGDYNLKLPRAWIETMKRCPDEQFDSRLQQLQKEALENSFESDFSHHHDLRQKEPYLLGAGMATNGQWSETLSIQQSAEQASHGQLTGILAAGERTMSGGKLIEGGGMCRMESSTKVFERTSNIDCCLASGSGGGGGSGGGIGGIGGSSGVSGGGGFVSGSSGFVSGSSGFVSGGGGVGGDNLMAVRRVKLEDLEGETNEIKKENFLKIYHAYRQYLLVRYAQSKA